MAEQELIDKTLQIWQPSYKQALEPRDGEEIIANWNAFICLVAEWAAITYEQKTHVETPHINLRNKTVND